MPVNKSHPNILGIQPGFEPFLYTHFDAWEVEHDSKEAASLAKELCDEWNEATGIDFSEIADKYSVLGQVPFFAEAAMLFAKNGYLVYDGDQSFDVYNLPTTEKLAGLYEEFKKNTDSDGELPLEDDFLVAVFAQLPNLLKAVDELQALKSHLEEALWTSIFDADNSEEVKAAEESGMVADLASATAVLDALNSGKPLVKVISQ